ncbi:hypothetical protein THAOC_13653 [Thalassiosira oceanica]|uniref:Uncharacterized protein n=1 Tax=Thalassiosira oceanica TaxID=159749 RepID=K0SH17_THAOC|nr:hypothetical protein THAOC_13653 [Thalassiosira oceanica]|eukprot:EJK65478.1 hypothetical protein THAOC_13653 [Thalassiosira oceanica]
MERVAGQSPKDRIWTLYSAVSKSNFSGKYTLVDEGGVDIELEESCVKELCDIGEIALLSQGQEVFSHNPATNAFDLADVMSENSRGGELESGTETTAPGNAAKEGRGRERERERERRERDAAERGQLAKSITLLLQRCASSATAFLAT